VRQYLPRPAATVASLWAIGAFPTLLRKRQEIEWHVPVLPQVTVFANTTAHIDERAADSEIEVTTPRPAVPVNENFELRHTSAAGPASWTWWIGGYALVFISPTTRLATVGTWSRRESGARLPAGWSCGLTRRGAPTGDRPCAVQPMMTLEYAVAGESLHGATRAGPQTIHLSVGHLQLVNGVRVTRAAMSVSFDGGTTWHRARVTGHGGSYTATFSARRVRRCHCAPAPPTRRAARSPRPSRPPTRYRRGRRNPARPRYAVARGQGALAALRSRIPRRVPGRITSWAAELQVYRMHGTAWPEPPGR
jgi:hypothetical protein